MLNIQNKPFVSQGTACAHKNELYLAHQLGQHHYLNTNLNNSKIIQSFLYSSR